MLLRPLAILTLAFAPLCIHANDTKSWRSELFPDDWRPDRVDAQGRFLHDFSHAGYRRGEQTLPRLERPLFDVVEQFGADNTGKTDATDAIQAAVSAAQTAGGGVVFMPAGDYLCLGGISIRKNGVVIRGAGPEKTRLFFHDDTSEKAVNIMISGEASADLDAPLLQDGERFSRDLFVEDAASGPWATTST